MSVARQSHGQGLIVMGFLAQVKRSRMAVTATSTQPTLGLVVEDCFESACQGTEHVPLRFNS
jgi:hypothetical protein